MDPRTKDMPAISTLLHPKENLQRPSHAFQNPSSPRPVQELDSYTYPPKQPLSTLPSPHTGISSVSPSIRHPLTRPLSPDLPTRDALYIFSNFSSYMRSPHEGADGIKSSEDFKDTVRLLEYARVSQYDLLTSLSWSLYPLIHRQTFISFISNIDSKDQRRRLDHHMPRVIMSYLWIIGIPRVDCETQYHSLSPLCMIP